MIKLIKESQIKLKTLTRKCRDLKQKNTENKGTVKHSIGILVSDKNKI